MKKTIGIIGGMGPAATVDLFGKIVDNTAAASDQEHIHILVDCNTAVPDRTAAILSGGADPLPELTASARRLQEAGADFLVMACNTAHYFCDRVAAAVDIPILSMIETAADYIAAQGGSSAVILATDGTIRSDVYGRCLRARGIDPVCPPAELQSEIMRIIYEGVKAGRPDWDADFFNRELEKLETEHNALSLTACTELPLAVRLYGLRGHFADPTLLLARAAVRAAGYELKGAD